MRLWLLCLLPCLAGCAGNVADYIGPRGTIVTPQLIRFGFTLEAARCVGDAMGRTVRPVDLRRLVRAAAPVRRGAAAPDRLAPSDLVAVAGTLGRPEVRTSLQAAMRSCNAAADPVTVTTLTELPRPDGTFASSSPTPVVRPPTWLNLGAAGSSQSIAIDASTIEQAETTRTAWFRLTDPGAPASDNAYLLVIDCVRRTINARARERRDSAGAVLERVDYPDNPLPVENGTVMEIAFLAMCT